MCLSQGWKWIATSKQTQNQNIPGESQQPTDTAAAAAPISIAKPPHQSWEDVIYETVMENAPVGTRCPEIHYPRTRSGRRSCVPR